MFWRVFKSGVLLLLIVAVAIWFAENPGTVSIQWFGVIVDVPLALGLLASVVIVALGAVAYRFWRYLRTSPKVLGHFRSERRLHQGYEALNQGFTAIAIGDAIEAVKQAKRAEKLLNDPALTVLVSAQAAQLQGDHEAAIRFFEQLMNTKGLEFLGLRGLYHQATQANEASEALALAERAFALKPKTPWLVDALIERYQDQGDWAQAQNMVDHALKHKLRNPAEMTALKAVLISERAKEALAAGEVDGALRLADQAHKLNPEQSAAVLTLIACYEQKSKPRKVIALCEKAWPVQGLPALAQAYIKALDITDPLKRFSALEKLCGSSRTMPESRLLLAGAALTAQMWGVARDHLTVLCEEYPSVTAFELMADLVLSEPRLPL